VVDNKLYVFGGFEVNVDMTSAIYRFDPAAAAGSRWTLMTATLPTPLGYIPTAASGGLIYLLGGSSFDTTQDPAVVLDNDTAFSYDPVADTVTAVTAIPRATGETRAVTQTDGSIWVLGGGRVDPNPGSEVDVYTPSTDTWTTAPALITPRRNFAADIDPASGDIWATGGYDADNNQFSVNEQFSACTVDDTIFINGFDGPV
jgi:N-acetylneuraminic acid mutarotase